MKIKYNRKKIMKGEIAKKKSFLEMISYYIISN